MIDLYELYWAAGFIEGEGSFQAPKRKTGRYDLTIKCPQIQRQPLERLQKLFGGSIYSYECISSWELVGAKSAALMMTLWTLMSPRRKKQIEEVLGKWKTNRSRREAALMRWSYE